MVREQLRIAVSIFILLTILTGIAYPCLITGIAQIFFHDEANGSLISHDGKIVGSVLIGQPFDDPKYLWGRPSRTSPTPYNASSSSGSNIGPSNPSLRESVKARVAVMRGADPHNKRPVPIDLVTSSGSGLDPHISVAGAYYQMPRMAKARGISEYVVKAIIQRNTERRLFGVIGEPVVNVLKVNKDLDLLYAEHLPKYKK
jgi:K+-transporting ATPase KdpC subunit